MIFLEVIRKKGRMFRRPSFSPEIILVIDRYGDLLFLNEDHVVVNGTYNLNVGDIYADDWEEYIE